MTDAKPDQPPKYTGKAMDRHYPGQNADVTYSLKRCIHAEECVRRLGSVFDPHRRPWIQVKSETADQLQEIIQHCPSGALHLERKDGNPGESTPPINTIRLRKDGPYQFSGDLEIHGAHVEVEHETRATLCRCGSSYNKPFCDNMHKTDGFMASDRMAVDMGFTPESPTTGGKLKITTTENGPYQVEGEFQIVNEEGTVLFTGSEVWLCRCGRSSQKPFCDSTHETFGFKAE